MSSSSATRHLMAGSRRLSRHLERDVLRSAAAAAAGYHRNFGSVTPAASSSSRSNIPVDSSFGMFRMRSAGVLGSSGAPTSRNLSSEAIGKASAAAEEKPAEPPKTEEGQEQRAEETSGGGAADADADADAEGGEGEGEVSREAELEAQVKDLKDQLLRSLAEQENTRRIAKRDVDAARSYAVTSFAKSLLDTSDNLSRAMESVPPEYRDDSENHPVLATLYEGIKMTDENLLKAFAKNGLVRYGEVGEKFDPNMHEALFEYPDPKSEVGSISQVMKAGFKLNERVIRPAEVGVVKKA